MNINTLMFQFSASEVSKKCAGVVLLVHYDFGNGHSISIQDTAENIEKIEFEHYYIAYERTSFIFSAKAT